MQVAVKCILYVLLIVFFTSDANAGVTEPTITIDAKSSVSTNRFNISIYKDKRHVKIVYTLFDSLITKDVKADTAIKAIISKSNSSDAQSRKVMLNQMAVLFEKHAAYSTDSITIKLKTDKAYLHLMDVVINTNADVLENTGKTKNLIVLDGVGIGYRMETPSGIKNVYAYSPSAKTYQLLY